MILKNLTLKNYRRFKNLSLDFEENVTAFIGKNGSGKTTIFEAILYALFGTQMARTTKENIKADFADQKQACKVCLSFSLDGKEYRIERSIKGKNSITSAFVFTPEKGSKPIAERESGVNQFIKKLLGMDAATFKISVFSAQKELDKFSSLQPEKRKEEIRKLLKIDIIKEAITFLRRDLRDNQKKIEAFKSRQKNTKEIKNSIDGFRNNLVQQKLALKKISFRFQTIKLSLNEQKARVADLEKLSQTARQIGKETITFKVELKVIKENISQAEDKIIDLNKKQKRLTRLFPFKQEFEKTKLSKDNFSQNILYKELEKLNKENEEIKIKINGQKINLERIKQEGIFLNKELHKPKQKLEKIKKLGPSSLCPTCTRPLKEHYQLLLKRFNQEIEKIALEMKNKRGEYKTAFQTINVLGQKKQRIDQKAILVEKEIKEKQQKLETKLRLLEKDNQEIIKLEIEIRQLAKIKANKNQFLEKQKSYNSQLTQLIKKRGSLNFDEQEFVQERNKQESIQLEYETAIKELSQNKGNIKTIKVDLKHSQEKFKEQIVLKKEIKILLKENRGLASLEPLLQEFEKDLLVRIRPVLERETSKLLQIMTKGKYSSIELDSDYQIQTYDKGTKYKIARFSGGEEDLINLCLRLAISRVIAEKRGSRKINFLILDEIFSSQDEERQNNIIKALQGLSTQFRQLFLITHVTSLKDKMPIVYKVSEINKNESSVKLL